MGDKEMVSMRLPGDLMKELRRVAEENGWTLTDIITTVLDQYVQQENDKRAK